MSKKKIEKIAEVNIEAMESEKIVFFIICNNHYEKMEGMVSCSSSTINNPFCIEMRKIEGTVCSKCYVKSKNRFENFVKKYNNDFYLKNVIASDSDIPFLNVAYFRIEAFGELETPIQAMNYIKLIQKNKHVNFAWWTKRPDIIKKAMLYMDLKELPKHVNVILSSVYLNCKDLEKFEKYDFIKGLFTVYTADYLTNSTEILKINCGGKKCIDCLNCYKKHSKKFIINELLKNDQKKTKKTKK